VPPNILAQLGNRVQHALRAFTPDDDKALRAAARTFPKTDHYDVEETLTTLGTGEALVTVLTPNGSPTAPFATKIAPPASRMGPLTPPEMAPLLRTDQVRHYATPIDRVSAHEILSGRMAQRREEQEVDTENYGEPSRPTGGRGRGGDQEEDSSWTDALKSPVARTIAREVTRGLLGALLGKRPRRRTRGFF
jgi:uncharacterized protein